MSRPKLKLRITKNFDKGLETIRLFLGESGQKAFQSLLEELFENILPSLSSFPQLGRSFLHRSPGSLEAARKQRALKQLLKSGEDLREMIFSDYLILYLLTKKEVVLLSLKHHRQLSYDLKGLWVS